MVVMFSIQNKATTTTAEDCCVKVAIHIRPLIGDEKLHTTRMWTLADFAAGIDDDGAAGIDDDRGVGCRNRRCWGCRLPESTMIEVVIEVVLAGIDEYECQACQDCVAVVPGKPQVQLGTHSFTFDHVYGSSGSPSSAMFEDCVSPLVDGLFQGYNATVLAYDQATMGTRFKDGYQ
ncbi:hypothetical protein LXL04_005003 [Taraxacum kok-saghyz]